MESGSWLEFKLRMELLFSYSTAMWGSCFGYSIVIKLTSFSYSFVRMEVACSIEATCSVADP